MPTLLDSLPAADKADPFVEMEREQVRLRAQLDAQIAADQAVKFEYLVRFMVSLPDDDERALFLAQFGEHHHEDLVTRLRRATWARLQGRRLTMQAALA